MHGIVVVVVDEIISIKTAGALYDRISRYTERKLLESKIAFKIFFLYQSKKSPRPTKQSLGR
jgi:hypothetical protein